LSLWDGSRICISLVGRGRIKQISVQRGREGFKEMSCLILVDGQVNDGGESLRTCSRVRGFRAVSACGVRSTTTKGKKEKFQGLNGPGTQSPDKVGQVNEAVEPAQNEDAEDASQKKKRA